MDLNCRLLSEMTIMNKAVHSVRCENIDSSLLEFIPHLMRGRDKL
ncbi:MAG: hypothetical protein ACYTFW_26880 [Planctomycetota bacterium]